MVLRPAGVFFPSIVRLPETPAWVTAIRKVLRNVPVQKHATCFYIHGHKIVTNYLTITSFENSAGSLSGDPTRTKVFCNKSIIYQKNQRMVFYKEVKFYCKG